MAIKAIHLKINASRQNYTFFIFAFINCNGVHLPISGYHAGKPVDISASIYTKATILTYHPFLQCGCFLNVLCRKGSVGKQHHHYTKHIFVPHDVVQGLIFANINPAMIACASP
jgi:hypothetical protein